MGLFREILNSNDIYGYFAHLNLDKKDDAHHTLCGGLFSIIAKMSLILYVVLRTTILLNGTGDFNSSQAKLLDEK